jgi:hypothetical protein
MKIDKQETKTLHQLGLMFNQAVCHKIKQKTLNKFGMVKDQVARLLIQNKKLRIDYKVNNQKTKKVKSFLSMMMI